MANAGKSAISEVMAKTAISEVMAKTARSTKSAISDMAKTARSTKSDIEGSDAQNDDTRYFASFQNAPPEEDDDQYRFKLSSGIAEALRAGGTLSDKDHGEVIMEEDWRMFHMAQEVMRIMVCARSFEVRGNDERSQRGDDLRSMAQDMNEKTMRSMVTMYENEKTVVSAVELTKYQEVVKAAEMDQKTKDNPKRAAAAELLKDAMAGKRPITAAELAQTLATLADDVDVDRETIAPMLAFMTEKGILSTESIEKITMEIQDLVKTMPKLLMKDVIPIILKYADTEKLK